MAILPFIHEIIYTCAQSTDGTDELLLHIKEKYAGEKLKTFYRNSENGDFNFNPMDMKAYNEAFNFAIDRATGDACWFLHPDMIVTNPEAIGRIPDVYQAWWTNITSYARDLDTQIVKGRATRWKNMHRKQFGLHYFGAYGSVNEDFYHSAITGNEHRHFGEEFSEYPFEVGDSEISVNHYCELKDYSRRLEKMKLCLKTQYPQLSDEAIHEAAIAHPRVSLETENKKFGSFAFGKATERPPIVFEKYQEEFASFRKTLVPA